MIDTCFEHVPLCLIQTFDMAQIFSFFFFWGETKSASDKHQQKTMMNNISILPKQLKQIHIHGYIFSCRIQACLSDFLRDHNFPEYICHRSITTDECTEPFRISISGRKLGYAAAFGRNEWFIVLTTLINEYAFYRLRTHQPPTPD